MEVVAAYYPVPIFRLEPSALLIRLVDDGKYLDVELFEVHQLRDGLRQFFDGVHGKVEELKLVLEFGQSLRYRCELVAREIEVNKRSYGMSCRGGDEEGL